MDELNVIEMITIIRTEIKIDGDKLLLLFLWLGESIGFIELKSMEVQMNWGLKPGSNSWSSTGWPLKAGQLFWVTFLLPTRNHVITTTIPVPK